MALGNKFLDEELTVEEVVRKNFASALADNGFAVAHSTDVAEDAIVVDLDILQFWCCSHLVSGLSPSAPRL